MALFSSSHFDLDQVIASVTGSDNKFVPLRAPEGFGHFSENFALDIDQANKLLESAKKAMDSGDRAEAETLAKEARAHWKKVCLFMLRFVIGGQPFIQKWRHFLKGVGRPIPFSFDFSQAAHEFLTQNEALAEAFGFGDAGCAVAPVRQGDDNELYYRAFTGVPPVPVPNLPEFSESALNKALAQLEAEGFLFIFKKNSDGTFALTFFTGKEGNPFENAYQYPHYYGIIQEYALGLIRYYSNEEQEKENNKPAAVEGQPIVDEEDDEASSQAAASGRPIAAR